MKVDARLVKIAGSSAIVLSLVAGYFLVVAPFNAEREAARLEIVASEESIATLETELVRLQDVRANISDIQALDSQTSEIAPTTASVPQLNAQIAQAAERAGLSAGAITAVTTEIPTLVNAAGTATDPAAPVDTGAPVEDVPNENPEAVDPAAAPAEVAAPTGSLAEMNLTITATGNNVQLSRLLSELAGMPRALLITNAAIAGEENAEGTLTVTAKTFLYRPIELPTEEAVEGDETTGEEVPVP